MAPNTSPATFLDVSGDVLVSRSHDWEHIFFAKKSFPFGMGIADGFVLPSFFGGNLVPQRISRDPKPDLDKSLVVPYKEFDEFFL